MDRFISHVSGKLYANRGYVSQKLADILFVDGIHLVAKMRNNMNGGELPMIFVRLPWNVQRYTCLNEYYFIFLLQKQK
jgi:hypothetical protein